MLRDRSELHPRLTLDQRIDPQTDHASGHVCMYEFKNCMWILKYDFGVFDNNLHNFVILNSDYLVNVGETVSLYPKWS